MVAEGAGFEPAIRFPVYTLSRRAPSTTRPPLRRRVLDPPVANLAGAGSPASSTLRKSGGAALGRRAVRERAVRYHEAGAGRKRGPVAMHRQVRRPGGQACRPGRPVCRPGAPSLRRGRGKSCSPAGCPPIVESRHSQVPICEIPRAVAALSSTGGRLPPMRAARLASISAGLPERDGRGQANVRPAA